MAELLNLKTEASYAIGRSNAYVTMGNPTKTSRRRVVYTIVRQERKGFDLRENLFAYRAILPE
ncbi:hypothetical protein GCM10028806_52430 [Spirosoma terrae]